MPQTALITGASRGIGRAAAEQFIDLGYSVIVTCTSHPERLQALCERASARQVSCRICVLDFSDASSVCRFTKELSHYSFDLLINNAAISHVGLLQDMTPEQWTRMIEVNLSSLYHTCRIAIPKFLAQGHGRILNISSVWGNRGASCEVAYSAAKGGVNSFTRALAKELAPHHIPVNAIAFGAVDTEMNAFLSPQELADLEGEIPFGRMATKKEAGEIIVRTSQLPSYITGQIITADGGWT